MNEGEVAVEVPLALEEQSTDTQAQEQTFELEETEDKWSDCDSSDQTFDQGSSSSSEHKVAET